MGRWLVILGPQRAAHPPHRPASAMNTARAQAKVDSIDGEEGAPLLHTAVSVGLERHNRMLEELLKGQRKMQETVDGIQRVLLASGLLGQTETLVEDLDAPTGV